MLQSWRCSIHRQIHTEPLSRRQPRSEQIDGCGVNLTVWMFRTGLRACTTAARTVMPVSIEVAARVGSTTGSLWVATVGGSTVPV
jgi:hypothetical protein